MSKANLLLHVDTYADGNELAGQPGGWSRLRREWFESLPMTGREFSQAQQMQATVSHKLRCIYFAGANSRMRLTTGDDVNNPTRTFNVVSVVNVEEKNRELEWMAEEVV